MLLVPHPTASRTSSIQRRLHPWQPCYHQHHRPTEFSKKQYQLVASCRRIALPPLLREDASCHRRKPHHIVHKEDLTTSYTRRPRQPCTPEEPSHRTTKLVAYRQTYAILSRSMTKAYSYHDVSIGTSINSRQRREPLLLHSTSPSSYKSLIKAVVLQVFTPVKVHLYNWVTNIAVDTIQQHGSI